VQLEDTDSDSAPPLKPCLLGWIGITKLYLDDSWNNMRREACRQCRSLSGFPWMAADFVARARYTERLPPSGAAPHHRDLWSRWLLALLLFLLQTGVPYNSGADRR
jgi:hypothetical protein